MDPRKFDSRTPFIKAKEKKYKTYRIKDDTCHIYTDASFNQFHKIGTYGSVIIVKDNWYYNSSELKSVTCITDCETKAIINSLVILEQKIKEGEVSGIQNICVYTDSAQAIKHLTDQSPTNPDHKFFYLKAYYTNFVNMLAVNIKFFKVRAHTDNESVITVINNFCDELSKSEMAAAIVHKNKPKLRITNVNECLSKLFILIKKSEWEEFSKYLKENIDNISQHNLNLVMSVIRTSKAPIEIINDCEKLSAQ